MCVCWEVYVCVCVGQMAESNGQLDDLQRVCSDVCKFVDEASIKQLEKL